MWGMSATEAANTNTSHISAHAGWVSQKIGTGPIDNISILTRGTGINTAGFLVITDGSPLAQGTGVNISYTIANTANLLQASSSNPALNGINTITIVSVGSLYSNASYLTTKVSVPANTTQPTFNIVLGGKGGRISYETIVAMGSMTDDNSADDTYFPGT